MRCRPRMLSHVIGMPFIALHSTHTALQLPQSPLLPCRRNISFLANSYPLKRRKFHLCQPTICPWDSEDVSLGERQLLYYSFVLFPSQLPVIELTEWLCQGLVCTSLSTRTHLSLYCLCLG